MHHPDSKSISFLLSLWIKDSNAEFPMLAGRACITDPSAIKKAL
tara:strand:+ start:26176 stop:26307 length:132 start_codon:yes stop_codon:yes gene_type:complete